MTTMHLEVYEAFRSLDVSEDKAAKAPVVLGKTGDELTTLRADMNTRFNKVDVDLAIIKGDQVLVRWMLGFMLALQVAVLFKLFTH
ncbi:hypothetical protein [Lichenibacterium ramalinae]|uniref:DUF1640 domain-containing protein n=1 Tax=Lichenibacterium ramalinae TaxID=2316527 RepID=A0A4Q2R7L5_9HYPH|nr:hypothetical protein [Lichenibacterium ramalinae]RYB01484.1 hypothetical protein D3272_25890 [Lichenibacterium ramalinae]